MIDFCDNQTEERTMKIIYSRMSKKDYRMMIIYCREIGSLRRGSVSYPVAAVEVGCVSGVVTAARVRRGIGAACSSRALKVSIVTH